MNTIDEYDGEDDEFDRVLMGFSREEGELEYKEGDRHGHVKITCMADSAAADTVFPTAWFPEVPAQESEASKAGVEYTAANGKRLPNRGCKDLDVCTADGTMRKMRVQLADIHKPLFSIGRSTARGHRVVLDEGGDSYIEHRGSGHRVPLRKEKGVFVFDLWVKVPSEGFSRPR